MQLMLSRCEVRSWRPDDLTSLVSTPTTARSGSTCAIVSHPYTRQAGREFLRTALTQRPETLFAIAVGGEAVGGIGFVMMPDVERVSAEIGYWLAEPFWGGGLRPRRSSP